MPLITQEVKTKVLGLTLLGKSAEEVGEELGFQPEIISSIIRKSQEVNQHDSKYFTAYVDSLVQDTSLSSNEIKNKALRLFEAARLKLAFTLQNPKIYSELDLEQIQALGGLTRTIQLLGGSFNLNLGETATLDDILNASAEGEGDKYLENKDDSEEGL